MVTLKLALTADGYAAGDEHDPRLAITGEAANGAVQVMRSLHDAIMIGVGTAREDDPLLTVRLPGVAQRPLRVVLDSRLELPLARASSRPRANSRRWSSRRRPRRPSAKRRSQPRASKRRGSKPIRRRGRSRRGAPAAQQARRDARLLRGRPAGGVAADRARARRRSGAVLRPQAAGKARPTRARPAAHAALADPGRYRARGPETYGTDTLRRWERVG